VKKMKGRLKRKDYLPQNVALILLVSHFSFLFFSFSTLSACVVLDLSSN